MVLGQGMFVAAAGGIAGIAGAIAMTRLVRTLLFGVESTDPATFVSVIALLAAVALVASGLPACRAARVDPVVVLRGE
jgi:ABC-type antimicrobial peptide transport system permease subunit